MIRKYKNCSYIKLQHFSRSLTLKFIGSVISIHSVKLFTSTTFSEGNYKDVDIKTSVTTANDAST